MLTAALEELLAWWWTATRKPLAAHLALESAAGPDGPLVAQDGSLASVWRITGVRRIADAAAREQGAALLAERLGPLLRDPGHALQWVYAQDPDAGSAEVADHLQTARSGADAAGLDLADVLAERAVRLAPQAVSEQALLVAWTRPQALPREQRRRDFRLRRLRMARWPARPGTAQTGGCALDSLPPRHEALAAAIPDAAREAGLELTPLDAAGALGRLREALNGAPPPAGWRPDIPGQAPHPPRVAAGTAGALCLPLAPQLIAAEPHATGNQVALDGRVFAPVDVLLLPRHPRPLEELLPRLAGIPFRMALLMEGGGLEGFRLSHALSSLLAWSDAGSALQRDALDVLALRRAEGDAIVRLRLTFATWADTHAPPGELDRRRSRLLQAVEAWGEMTASPLTGDPLETFCATVPAMTLAATAEPAAAPLADALTLAPLHRPGRLAATGPALFSTGDGRLQPFDPHQGGHSLDLIHGVPGRGKSVLLNSIALAWCLGGRTGQLPRLAIVDVGPSSRGLIALLRDALPPGRRHEAAWARLDGSQAVNPFDTPLGCRSAGPAGRALLANVLSAVIAGPDPGAPAEGLRDVLAAAIPVAYRMRDETEPSGEPAIWRRGRCPEADRALERHGVTLPERAPWWQVVDELFAAGEIRAAELAQRYAVPVTKDLISAARAPEVADLAGEARHTDGARLIEAFCRILTTTAWRLPMLSGPTQFDLAAARVAAVDVAGATGTGSAEAARAAGAAYLLARQALTGGWWSDSAETAAAPPPIRAWHAEHRRALQEEAKLLCYDEFHRLSAAPSVLGQVERDAREGRKLGVRIALASQSLADFPPRLVELSTRCWTFGAGGRPSELEELARTFPLSDGARERARSRLTGPGPGGAPVLLLAGAGDRRRELLLTVQLGPVELWALTTHPPDVALRTRLQERMEPREARRCLAARFPAGSAAEELLRRQQQLEERGLPATEAAALDSLAAELCNGVAGDAT